MAWPCTAAIVTNRGSRSQVKPRWKPSIALLIASSLELEQAGPRPRRVAGSSIAGRARR